MIPVFQQRARPTRASESAWRLVVGARRRGWASCWWCSRRSCAIWPEVPAALFHLDPERAADLPRSSSGSCRRPSPCRGSRRSSPRCSRSTAASRGRPRWASRSTSGSSGRSRSARAAIGIEAAAWGVVIGATAPGGAPAPAVLAPAARRPARGPPSAPAARVVGPAGAAGARRLGAAAGQQLHRQALRVDRSRRPRRRPELRQRARSGAPGRAAAAPADAALPVDRAPDVRAARAARPSAPSGAWRACSALVAIPIVLLMAIYATEVTQLAFQRGQCDADCVSETRPAAALLRARALAGVRCRCCSTAPCRPPTTSATSSGPRVATVTITIVLDLLLLGPMEQSGLALASTIGVYANAVMLIALLRHHFPSLSLRDLGAPAGAGPRGRAHRGGAWRSCRPGPAVPTTSPRSRCSRSA